MDEGEDERHGHTLRASFRPPGPLNAREGVTALTLWGGFASNVFIPIIQFLIETQGWRAHC